MLVLYSLTIFFSTPKLIGEMSKLSSGNKIREDTALLTLITSLKDLCNVLDIHLSTSTQVSDGWQNSKYPDSSLIRELVKVWQISVI